MLSSRSNPLIIAWQVAGERAAEAWEEIADELAEVRVRDVEATLKALSDTPREHISSPAIRLAAFCYGACAGPLDCRAELTKRAALILQRLLMVGQADEDTLPLALDAAERFPLHARRERYLSAKSIAESAAANYAWLRMFARSKSLDQEALERVEAARGNARRGSKLQLAAARELLRVDSDEWMALAESLMAAGKDQQTDGNSAEARELLIEAVQLADGRDLERADHVLFRGRIEAALGDILSEIDEDKALHYREDAKSHLRCAARAGAEGAWSALVEVLVALGGMVEDRGGIPDLRMHIEDALAVLEQQDGAQRAEAASLLEQLVSLIKIVHNAEKGTPDLRDRLSVLLEALLAEHGVLQAAHAGHRGASAIMEIEFHDHSSDWDSLTWNAPPDSRPEEPLVRLLNLDAAVLELRMDELAAERDAAVAHPGPVSLPGLTDVPRFQQSWERWSAVRTLQRLADALIPPDETACDRDVILASNDKIRLRGLTVREKEAVANCVHRAEMGSNISVAAGWPGERRGTINYELPAEDYYVGALDLEDSVDLIIRVDRLEGIDTSPLDVWIRQSLRQLARFGIHDQGRRTDCGVRLDRCVMPARDRGVGAAAIQDYLLGEGPSPPRCNRWYVWERKSRRACGCGRCQTIKSATTEENLEARALKLAEKHCRAASLPISLDEVGVALASVMAEKKCPRRALRRVKEIIDRAARQR